MKKLIILAGAFALVVSTFAQKPSAEKSQNSSECNLHCQHDYKCLSPRFIQYQERLKPGFARMVDKQFEIAKANSIRSDELYTIQVVVHIVYNTPNQNLSDDVIFNQMDSLNRDFQRLNADTTNMRPVFDIVKGNPNIQFVLASLDPEGNPTTGITRTETSVISFGSEIIFDLDFTDLEKVKSTADGGHDPWDQSKYLNIWVCNMELLGTTAILGYATPPPGLPNWEGYDLYDVLSDGVVIQYQFFGSNNPNPVNSGYPILGRTLSHEVGHYLGLRHVWGDGPCWETDGIDDTPNADETSAAFVCNLSLNTCFDNIFGIDLPDMVENYMNYSPDDCMNTFTQGQVDLMRGVLQNQRIELIQDIGVSTLELFSSQQFIIYPNPAKDHVYFRTPNSGVIEIFDLIGKLLIHVNVFAGNNTIDIHGLSSGTYITRYIDASNIQTGRFVVISN
jgi:hypothetical protein